MVIFFGLYLVGESKERQDCTLYQLQIHWHDVIVQIILITKIQPVLPDKLLMVVTHMITDLHHLKMEMPR